MLYYIILIGILILAIVDVVQYSTNTIGKNHIRVTIGNKTLISKDMNDIIFWVFMVILILFAALRWNVGADFGLYLRNYKLAREGHPDNLIDISFNIASVLLPSFTFVLMFYAFFSVKLSMSYIRNVSPYPYVTLLLFYSLFYLTYDMGVMRQGLAMAITLYSLNYVEKRQFWKFLMLIAISAIIHGSALCFVIIYILSYKKLPIYVYMGAVILCAGLGFSNIFSILISIISYLPIPNMAKYMMYFTDPYVNFSYNIMDAKEVILFSLFLWYSYKISHTKDEKTYYLLLNVYFVGVCIHLLFRPFHIIESRMAAIFTEVGILLITFVLKHTKTKLKKACLFSLIFFYTLRAVILVCNSSDDSWGNYPYIPYTVFFQK